MSDVRDDIGYRPAPATARELLSQHREAVDQVEHPTPSPYAGEALCPRCKRAVGVNPRWGTLRPHSAVIGGREWPCSGSGDSVGRAA